MSAHAKNASTVLRVAAGYLCSRHMPFKVLVDPLALELWNSKPFDRGSSGKFITIYPLTPESFRETLRDLHSLLRDEEGPYVLSDQRYEDSKTLYFRYGGFQRRAEVDIIGRHLPDIVTPSGTRVTDVRKPYFDPPSWVTWPFQDWKPPSPEVGLLGNRYEVLEAISFSNTGGVYKGRDVTDGKIVVLKEARPHTGFHGPHDAVSILHREWNLLNHLASTGVTPKPLAFLREWEHSFIVEEFVRGVDIRRLRQDLFTLGFRGPERGAGEKYHSYDDLYALATVMAYAIYLDEHDAPCTRGSDRT